MKLAMGKTALVLSFVLLLLFGDVSSASASPAKIFGRVFSNALPMLIKRLWSFKKTTKTAISSRPMMKFESGYNVETVFDGSKLGIEPYSAQALPGGELLIMDSANSNIYRISASLSLYSRPKLVAGSGEGHSGHVDGKAREARMNHPKGLAVDYRGNIYVADTMNLAIRKISDSGVTTIARGKWGGGGGHLDGQSEDSKFSNDFDVVYVGSSCSLLIVDRGNRAIREIQLHFDDCAYQYGSGFPMGVAMLAVAGFFGYILAVLQCKITAFGNSLSQNDQMKMNVPPYSYKKPLKSVRPPLIPSEEEPEKQEEGFFISAGKLVSNTGTSVWFIPGLRKKSPSYKHDTQQHQYFNSWPQQESFVIPNEDEPPSIDTRTPTPRKTYAFMSKDADKMHQLRQSKVFYNGWDSDKPQPQQKQQHHHQFLSSIPHTYYERSHERTNEIVFGAIQELDRKGEPSIVRPVDYADPGFEHHNIQARSDSMGCNNGY